MTLLVATNWRETKGKLTELTGPLEECHFPETISDPNIHFLSTHTHTRTNIHNCQVLLFFFFLFFLFSLSFPHFLAKFFPEKKKKNGIFRHYFRPYLTPFWFLAKGSLSFVVFVTKKVQFWAGDRESLPHHKIFPRKIGVSLSFL